VFFFFFLPFSNFGEFISSYFVMLAKH